MRLFIAIDLPKEIKNRFYELEKQIGNQQAKIKWVAKKNYHITLKFLGEMQEDKMQPITQKLKEIKYEKFKIKIQGFGVFPDDKQPRIIWAGIYDDKKLLGLFNKIDEETINVPNTYMRYNPHITLGRIGYIKNKKKLIEKISEIKLEAIEVQIEEFQLFQSELTKDGPQYKILKRYKLN